MPKRPTPAVVDAMRILDFLCAQAPAQLGASAIARALGISVSSCHAILQTLQAGGYVMQNPLDKTFALGPALIRLGLAAAGDPGYVEAARAALPALAARVGFTATAWRLAADGRVTLVAQATSQRPLHVAFAVGQSQPLLLPMGAVFLAWASPAEVDRFLEAAAAGGFGPSPEELSHFRAELRRTRARGFAYTVAANFDTPAGLAELEAWLERAAEVGLDERSEAERAAYLAVVRRAAALRPEMRRESGLPPPAPTVTVGAPVFDRQGRVVLNLVIAGFASEIPPEKVVELAREGRRTADGVTAAVGGCPPEEADGPPDAWG